MRKVTSFFVAIVALVGLLALPTVASAQSTTRLAIVDMARALNDVEDGQDARRRLERDMERRQEEINERQEALQEFMEELEAGFEMLTEEARQQRLQQYQAQVQELQQLYAQHQEELARAEAEATRGILERVAAIVEEIAEEQDYTMVLERSAVLYSVTGTDITDRVVREYNSRH